MSSRHRWFIAALAITVCLGTGPEAWAQTRSTVTGTIRDDARAPLSGVAVTLVSVGAPRGPQTTRTNSRGEYRLPEVPPGLYELTAELQAFPPTKPTELRVGMATTVTLDVMVTKSATDIVTLSVASSIVDVMAPAATIAFSREDLENLPVTGLGFLQLGPGIVPNGAFGSGPDTNHLTGAIREFGKILEQDARHAVALGLLART